MADAAPAPFDVSSFQERGYVTTPALFDTTTLYSVRREIERLWGVEVERASRGGDPRRVGFVRARPELQRLHAQSPVLSAFCRGRVFANLALALGAGDTDLLYNQAYAKAPGGDPRTRIPWHQDAWYAETDRLTYNCWVAITRVTVANGTLAFVPAPEGLHDHRWDPELEFYTCEVAEAGAQAVALAPGQAFVYTGRVPHASGPNRTTDPRIAYSVAFAQAGVRLRKNGEPFGDRVPITRAGRSVAEWFFAWAGGDASAEGPARAVLDEIAARVPDGRAQVAARVAAFRLHLDAGQPAAADLALGELLALRPADVEVLGDLVRARTRTDQLFAEYATVRASDPRSARLLIERVLELDPGNEEARAALRELGDG